MIAQKVKELDEAVRQHLRAGPLVRIDVIHGEVFLDGVSFGRDKQANAQIIQADEYIQRHTDSHAARLFAYPYGETTEYLIEEYFPNYMPQHRMLAAFTTGGEYATRASNQWNIPRFMCGLHWKSPEGLEKILREATRN